MFGLREQATYLRCEYLFRAGDSPLPVVEGFHRGVTDAGLEFSYFKGNDSLLHYTLVDWSSGARRMVDVYHQVRALWHKRKHPGEWLYAAFRGDFKLEQERSSTKRSTMGGSDRLELSEVGVRLAYNGKAFMGRETLSLVATCHASGVLTDLGPEACQHNLAILMAAFSNAWCETRPLFGWIGVGTRPDVDVPPLVGRTRIPREAWYAFYPPGMVQEILDLASRSRGSFGTSELDDGSLLLENLKIRPGDLCDRSTATQDRRCP